MEGLALWDKSHEDQATVFRLDNKCNERQLHTKEYVVKCLSNKEAVMEKYQIFTFGFLAN